MLLATLVAGCGGGGVSSSGSLPPPTSTTPTPSPTPVPTPTPTPTPSPTPTPTGSASSAEYQASGAAVLANAAYAYDRGVTGRGVTIAVLDTGINRTTPEFAGRISADSTGFEQKVARCATCASETVAPYPIDDRVGHGTEVASVAAAARNGSGPQGLAPDATILTLKIVAADVDGLTAGSTTPVPEGSGINSGLIAPALRYAVDHGAFVSVMSVNGTSGGQLAAEQRAAMDGVRAADRLVVESVSNDTGRDSFAGQIAEALVGADGANRDWFLFAVGLDRNGVPRPSNGNPGALADRTLAAAGNGVQVVDRDGAYATVTGNSFAAPAVAGAAALLKQYWPQLGGRAIGRILLDTATDAGAPGPDAVYGVGILNVEKAMQAQAPAAAFATAQAVLAGFSTMTVSAPFGGAAASAIAGQTGGMTVLDRYGRDYRMEIAGGPRVRGSGLLSGAGIGPLQLQTAQSAAGARYGWSAPWNDQGRTRMPSVPAIATFSPARDQTVTLSADVAVGPSAGMAGSALRGVAYAPIGTMAAWTVRGWTAGFSSGASCDGRTSLGTASFATPLGLGFELTDMRERGGVLGLRPDGPASALASRTTLATLSLRRALLGTAFTATATASSTRTTGATPLLRFDGPVLGTAFSIEGARALFGGVATLGLSSPLRVERARVSMTVPAVYALNTGAFTTRTATHDLTPDARELDLALGFATRLAGRASARFGIVRAFDAGNVRGASDAAGFATFTLR